MYLQCQLDDLIRNSSVIFDFQLLKQALSNIHNGGEPVVYPGNSRILPPNQQNPILFLANYCMSQLYSRHMLSKQVTFLFCWRFYSVDLNCCLCLDNCER